LDFDGDGKYEAGIDFQLAGTDTSDISLTFFTIDQDTGWMGAVDFSGSSPWSAMISSYTDSQTSGTGSGQFTAYGYYSNNKDFDPDSSDVEDTLEFAIDLDTLSTSLATLFTSSTSLNLHWTMECGNDVLVASADIDYDRPDVPEPATLILFGFGLLGVSAIGRKKQSKIN